MLINTNNLSFDTVRLTLETQDGKMSFPDFLQSIPPRKAYFKITNTCNAHCPYCFQKHSFSEKLNITTYESLIKKVFHDYDEFVLFGGEPLNDAIYDIIKYMFEIGKEHPYTIFSNGYFGGQVRKLLEQYRSAIHYIIFSIDGDEHAHNIHRPINHGNGYKMLINNAKFLDSINVDYTWQYNLDKANVDCFDRMLASLQDNHVDAHPMILNRLMGTDRELKHYDYLTYYINIRRRYPNIPISSSSVTLSNLLDIFLNNGIPSASCYPQGNHVFNFENETIYYCSQNSNTIIGTFNTSNYYIDTSKIQSYCSTTPIMNDRCCQCELKSFCPYGCTKNRINGFEQNCKANVYQCLELILGNLKYIL